MYTKYLGLWREEEQVDRLEKSLKKLEKAERICRRRISFGVCERPDVEGGGVAGLRRA